MTTKTSNLLRIVKILCLLASIFITSNLIAGPARHEKPIEQDSGDDFLLFSTNPFELDSTSIKYFSEMELKFDRLQQR